MPALHRAHDCSLLNRALFSNSLCLIGGQLLYNMVLVFATHQHESAFSSVQLLSCVRLFVTPWTAAHQASLSITNSQILLKLMSIELVMLSCVQLFAKPWAATHLAPLSMGIIQARILEWVVMPSSRDLPNSGVELRSHALQILYHLRHQRSPRMLEWVAYPFCRESSRPRNPTGVSCIAGGFFTN